ncbi:hypothetical protein T09_9844 [Trichinella sp. T9]|nr:hypothetical protein T09_9844 [Trichinella sp. T9]
MKVAVSKNQKTEKTAENNTSYHHFIKIRLPENMSEDMKGMVGERSSWSKELKWRLEEGKVKKRLLLSECDLYSNQIEKLDK